MLESVANLDSFTASRGEDRDRPGDTNIWMPETAMNAARKLVHEATLTEGLVDAQTRYDRYVALSKNPNAMAFVVFVWRVSHKPWLDGRITMPPIAATRTTSQNCESPHLPEGCTEPLQAQLHFQKEQVTARL